MVPAGHKCYTSKIVIRQALFFPTFPYGTSSSQSPSGRAAFSDSASRQWCIHGGSGTGSDTAKSWKCVYQSCKGLNRNDEKPVCGKLAQLLSVLGLSLINTPVLSFHLHQAPTRDKCICCLISTNYLSDLFCLYQCPSGTNCCDGDDIV